MEKSELSIYNFLPVFLFIAYALIFRRFDSVFSMSSIVTILLFQIISIYCLNKLYRDGYFKGRRVTGIVSLLLILSIYWIGLTPY